MQCQTGIAAHAIDHHLLDLGLFTEHASSGWIGYWLFPLMTRAKERKDANQKRGEVGV